MNWFLPLKRISVEEFRKMYPANQDEGRGMMGILDRERERVKKEALLLSRAGAQRYAQRLEEALNLLHEFDDKCTDDLKGLRDSFENTGVVTCLVTTEQGYSALVSSDDILLATALPELLEGE